MFKNKKTVKGCILKGDTTKVKEISLVFIKKNTKKNLKCIQFNCQEMNIYIFDFIIYHQALRNYCITDLQSKY